MSLHRQMLRWLVGAVPSMWYRMQQTETMQTERVVLRQFVGRREYGVASTHAVAAARPQSEGHVRGESVKSIANSGQDS